MNHHPSDTTAPPAVEVAPQLLAQAKEAKAQGAPECDWVRLWEASWAAELKERK